MFGEADVHLPYSWQVYVTRFLKHFCCKVSCIAGEGIMGHL